MKRSQKRSRSGAQEKCPECGKKLRGVKGLVAHRLVAHGITPDRVVAKRA
jgi:ribosomal protein L34E